MATSSFLSRYWKWAVALLLALGIGVYIMWLPMARAQQEVRSMKIADVNLDKVKDGSYTGQFTYLSTTIEVRVTVKERRITAVDVVKNGTTDYARRAAAVTNYILKRQTPNVDVVSGATTTSKAIMKAVENALTGRQ